MGFISFNEKYYQKKLEEYENNSLSESKIYEAKQLLKILDDLADEGYTNLNNRMETDFSCITRLREVLKNNGAHPFPIDHERLPDTLYDDKDDEALVVIVDTVKVKTTVIRLKEELYKFTNFKDMYNYIFYSIDSVTDTTIPHIKF